MDLIAEGIESSYEEELLLQPGTGCCQGFHDSRALDADKFMQLMS